MKRDEIQKMNRATRIALNANSQQTIADAENTLRNLTLQIVIGASVARSATLQSAVLTAINVGKRTFRGGVKLVSGMDFSPLSPLAAPSKTFHEVAREFGATVVAQPLVDLPSILVGHDAELVGGIAVSLRIQVQGWCVAVTPAQDPIELNDESEVPLTGLFGASLALSEIFSASLRLNPEAGHRDIGMCLWKMTPQWRDVTDGPILKYLPSEFAIIGLGHLGQALAWVVRSLPHPDKGKVQITLQDDDVVGEENISTCVLTEPNVIGHRKTRVVSDWLEDCGFRTRLIEQLFETNDQFHRSGPALIFAGVDSADARVRLMDAAGDQVQIIDIGLGARPDNFDEIALHTSPISIQRRNQWSGAGERARTQLQDKLQQENFHEIANANGLDACGAVTFVNTAVGVPFVGMAAATIAWAEAIRRLATGQQAKDISCRLRSLTHSHRPNWLPESNPAVTWSFQVIPAP